MYIPYIATEPKRPSEAQRIFNVARCASLLDASPAVRTDLVTFFSVNVVCININIKIRDDLLHQEYSGSSHLLVQSLTYVPERNHGLISLWDM